MIKVLHTEPRPAVGDTGTLTIDVGQEIKEFAAANPLVVVGLVGLLGIGIYQIFKS